MINIKRFILLLGVCCMMFNPALALPDLVAEIYYTPKNASVGDTVNVTMIIHNLGDAIAYNVTFFVYGESDCFSPTPIPTTRPTIPVNSSINHTFNKTLRYGKLELKLIADPMNEINEINESNNNASISFNFPLMITTDKDVYLPNESININIIGNNGTGEVYVYTTENYNIFKYVNDSWNYIKTHHFGCGGYICINGELHRLVCAWIFRCISILINHTLIWDQKQLILKNLSCGNSSYEEFVREHVGPGKYKAVFCYRPFSCFCNRICIETTNFTISDAILTTSPRLTTVSPGTNFTIQINISGNNIYGTQFDLYFNSTILEVIDVTEGDFLKQRCTTTYSTSNINNTIGKITFANTCTGDNKADGSGVLCNITFKAKSNGSSNLNFDNVKILNNELQELYVVFNNGKVIVDSALLADMNNDYIIDIFDLATVGKAFGSMCGDIKYNEKADINKDCKIDIFDLAFVGKNFGKRW